MDHEVAFSLRLTDDAWQNLQQACDEEGLTNRSAIEAAVELVALFCTEPEQRHVLVPPHLDSPELESVVFTAWQFAVQLNERHRKGREARQKITIRTEAARLEALEQCLKKRARGVSVNSAVASVFTPWGHDWNRGSTIAYDLRKGLWSWASVSARQRDRARRSRPRSALLTARPAKS